MRGLSLALGAAALHAAIGMANEWPNCESDNCYRNFIDHRFKELGEEFCVDFLAATTTAPEAVPTEFGNCDGDVSAVSSVCSCITYSILTTSEEHVPSTSVPEVSSTEYVESSTTDEPSVPSSTAPPESSIISEVSSEEPASSTSDNFESSGPVSLPASETSSVSASPSSVASGTSSVDSRPSSVASEDASVHPSASELPSSSDSVSSVLYTTSTIYTTRIRTITECAPEQTGCPSGPVVTTEIIAVSTTVCPVSEPHPSKSLSTSKTYETGGSRPSYTHPYGTGSWAPSPTSPGKPFPTAGAERVGAGFAAIFGALAVAMI